jgi:hypothetical protein
VATTRAQGQRSTAAGPCVLLNENRRGDESGPPIYELQSNLGASTSVSKAPNSPATVSTARFLWPASRWPPPVRSRVSVRTCSRLSTPPGSLPMSNSAAKTSSSASPTTASPKLSTKPQPSSKLGGTSMPPRHHRLALPRRRRSGRHANQILAGIYRPTSVAFFTAATTSNSLATCQCCRPILLAHHFFLGNVN